MRSLLGSEPVAFTDLFDATYSLPAEIELFLGTEKLAIILLMDSSLLLDVIHKGTRTDEKRLMIDVSSIREGYHTDEISKIGSIPSRSFGRVEYQGRRCAVRFVMVEMGQTCNYAGTVYLTLKSVICMSRG